MTQRLDIKNYKNRHSTKSKVARMVWNVVWLFLFRPTPRGNLFRPWRILLLKLFCADVKWSSNVLPSCRIWQPWKLKMGAYACLGADVDCYAVAPIVLGDNAVVSQGVKLCTASHDIASPIMELTYAPIVIEANTWVAAWSIVLSDGTIVTTSYGCFDNTDFLKNLDFRTSIASKRINLSDIDELAAWLETQPKPEKTTNPVFGC